MVTFLSPGGGMDPARVGELHRLSLHCYSGFGQTKVIEDGNKVVREAEDSTSNKRLRITRQWDVLRTKGVLGQHGHQEVDPKPGMPHQPQPATKLPEGLYTAFGKQLS
eukprot:2334084-Lingulodinium_polyedra.AAC.1